MKSPPFRVISNAEVALCIGLAGIVYVALRMVGERGLDVACGAMSGVALSCIGTCWPLRRLPWFWLTAAILLSLHLLALFVVAWSAAAKWNGLTIMPFMAADTLVSLAVIYVVYRILYGRPDKLFVLADADDVRYSDRAEL